jgi:hypothetical protein
MPVETPVFEPSTKTETPGNGFPDFESVTLPSTFSICENPVAEVIKNRTVIMNLMH